MGPKSSQPDQSRTEALICHPRFTNAHIVTSVSRDNIASVIQVSFPVANETEYKQWVTELNSVPKDEALFFPLSHRFAKEGICGSNGFVVVEYEKFPFLLNDEIKNRNQNDDKRFEEPQIWYLLYTLLRGSYPLHSSNKKVGDIRPANIFINQQGQVKASTQFSWPGELSNFQKTLFSKTTTFLAPQQLKDLALRKVEESRPASECEAFSIGLTCLAAMTLTDPSSMYMTAEKLNQARLDEKCRQLWESGYSEILCMTVISMLQVEPENRSSCSQMLQWLEPYENEIINLQDFSVRKLSPKLQLVSQQRNKGRVQGVPQMTSSVVTGGPGGFQFPVGQNLMQPTATSIGNMAGLPVSQVLVGNPISQFIHPSGRNIHSVSQIGPAVSALPSGMHRQSQPFVVNSIPSQQQFYIPPQQQFNVSSQQQFQSNMQPQYVPNPPSTFHGTNHSKMEMLGRNSFNEVTNHPNFTEVSNNNQVSQTTTTNKTHTSIYQVKNDWQNKDTRNEGTGAGTKVSSSNYNYSSAMPNHQDLLRRIDEQLSVSRRLESEIARDFKANM